MLEGLDSKSASVLSTALAEIRTELKNVNKNLDDIKSKVEQVDKEVSTTRVAVGKLEVKNTLFAAVAGTLTGFFGSKFGGGGA